MTAPRLVLCNTPPEAAQALASALVEARLAACVNIIPQIQSVYRWKGKICQDPEATLFIKTCADRVAELTAKIVELHPAEVPEVISLDIRKDEGEPRYLAWLVDETRPG